MNDLILKPVGVSNAWHVIVNWLRPKKLQSFNIKPNDKEAYLYKVVQKRREGDTILWYIGMTYNQSVSRRLNQHHVIKNRPEFLISIGEIAMADGGNVTEGRVKDTESLLIYVHKPKKNKRKTQWISPRDELWVENRGYRSPLYRHLYYGTCAGFN